MLALGSLGFVLSLQELVDLFEGCFIRTMKEGHLAGLHRTKKPLLPGTLEAASSITFCATRTTTVIERVRESKVSVCLQPFTGFTGKLIARMRKHVVESPRKRG